jgi:DNA helicase-2/ATP-dependent DNA helicase PcrA
MDRYPITNPEEYPITADVKINGTAGTGKSTESQERLIRLMKEKNLSYFDVTVCTYRTALAKEQVQDLKNHNVIPQDLKHSDTFIGTIHGICRRLINNSDKVPFSVNDLVTDYHKHIFCTEVYDKQYYNNSPEKSEGEELFAVFSYMLSNNLTPDRISESKLSSWRSKWGKNANLRRIWDKWEAFKDNPPETVDADKLWDFDELLLIVKHADLIPPNTVLIIDEMHDVYPLLNDVIQLWISETTAQDDTTVIVAGDPYQVINEFQGATPEFYQQTDIDELVLNTTYRCPENIWQYAQSILLSEFSSIQDVKAEHSGGKVTELPSSTFSYNYKTNSWNMKNNSKWTPQKIISHYCSLSLQTEDSTSYNTVMFLARTRTQLKAIEQQIRDSGLIYAGHMDSSWSSNTDLLHLFNSFQKISQAILPESEDEYLVDYDGHFVYNFADTIKLTRPQLKLLLKKLPEQYIRQTDFGKRNYIDQKLPYSFSLNEVYFALTENFFRKSIQELIEDLSLDVSEKQKLANALERYDTTIEYNNLPVQLRTIHESKGMQAETVALYDSITTNIETSLDTESARQNECRTWFVGASRASENLLLLRDAFDGFDESPFLPQI